MRIRMIIILLTTTAILSAQSHFDNIDWQFTRNDKDIRLYTVSGGDCNYYKAETLITNPQGISAKDLFDAINNYQDYMEIFKNIEKFEPIGSAEGRHIISVLANFSPMNYRVYHIELWTSSSDGVYVTEWIPYTGDDVDRSITKKQKYITTVYGRWTFRDEPDDSIYICVEYHNNWDYTALSLATVTPFEQNVTVKNIRLLYDYTVKKKNK